MLVIEGREKLKLYNKNVLHDRRKIMNNSAVTRKPKGFTLVELLIVVIILAILAAIVVPQFTASTDDANDAALVSNLANIRSAIDLYYQQHGEYPSANLASGGTCAGTAGTGAADSVDAFKSQLTLYTDAEGVACSTRISSGTTETYIYGPYLQKSDLPNNPETNSNTLTIVTTGDLNLTGAAAPASGKGWKFDNKSGKFIADHADIDDL